MEKVKLWIDCWVDVMSGCFRLTRMFVSHTISEVEPMQIPSIVQ